MFVVLVEDDPYIAQSIVAALDYLNVSVEHVDTAKAADYFIGFRSDLFFLLQRFF